jgi:lipoprotein-releasing system ATP-binding protein
MNEPLVRAQGVGRTYELGKRSLEVLRGVNLTVDAGDFLALRGASGAGKSTLLHLLGGLDTPKIGRAHV